MTVSAQYNFTPGTTILSAEVNDNFNRLYLDTTGNLGLSNYDAQHATDGTHGDITCTDLIVNTGGDVVVSGSNIFQINSTNVTLNATVDTINGSTSVIINGGYITLNSTAAAGIIMHGGPVYITANVRITGDVTFSGSLVGNIDGSQILNASLTGSTKLVTGSVTVSKLASMGTGVVTGSAGDICLSLSCGAFELVSASWTAVTNLSVTLTTTGRPVFISLVSDGDASHPAYLYMAGASNSRLGVRIYRDSTIISTTLQGDDDNNIFPERPTSVQHIDVVAAGTYTYTIQVPADLQHTYVYYCKLVAFEL